MALETFSGSNSQNGQEKERGRSFHITISPDAEGLRLDQFLSREDLGLSRSQAKKLIEEGRILLNGRPAKPSAHLKMNDRVSGWLREPEPLALRPEGLPFSILYEDASIIVVDKPPNMVVHPAPGNPTGTLVNALLHHCTDLGGINGVIRPGIVHRLDKGTSGVMVVAKDDQAYQHLAKQFKNRSVEKAYLALATGHFHQDEGVIDWAIGRHPRERKRMSIHTKKGRPAVTRWRVLERFPGVTFLQILPQTGRTHQIRVHLASMGHPLLGDPLYGRKGNVSSTFDPRLRELIKAMGRQALHAERLRIIHPRTGEKVEFHSPLPEDMERVLIHLRIGRKTS